MKKCEGMDCENLFKPRNWKARRCKKCHKRNTPYKDGTINEVHAEKIRRHQRKRNSKLRIYVEGKGWQKPEWEIKLRKNLDKLRCFHCLTQWNLTLDHRIKLGDGGRHELENIQILCRDCHDIKDNN